MERAWRERGEYVCSLSGYCVIEKVLEWLERGDTELERVTGYGICLASCTYFIARLIQLLIR